AQEPRGPYRGGGGRRRDAGRLGLVCPRVILGRIAGNEPKRDRGEQPESSIQQEHAAPVGLVRRRVPEPGEGCPGGEERGYRPADAPAECDGATQTAALRRPGPSLHPRPPVSAHPLLRRALA